MQISMIGPFGFHPNKTMQSRAFGFARALVKMGHDVGIYMPPWHTPDEADKHWVEDGVRIRYVPLNGGVLGITRRLVHEATAGQPDIIHCFKPKAYSGLAAWWLWVSHRQKYRLITDSDDWEGPGGWNDKNPYSPLQKQFFAWQERWGLRHNHRLTLASEALQEIAWSMGIPKAQTAYLPNGPGVQQSYDVGSSHWINARQQVRENLGIGERPLLLLYSRLFEFDPDRLVDMLVRIKSAVPTLCVLNIGAGLFAQDSAILRQKLVEFDLVESVIDAGWLELAELPAYFAAADVGIYLMDDTLLNRTKCPVKLADMVTAGLPIVGEAVGQVRSYVQNGRSGYLHPSGDVAGLADSTIKLLQTDGCRQEMAQAAQAHGQQFAWHHLAHRLEMVYAECLNL